MKVIKTIYTKMYKVKSKFLQQFIKKQLCRIRSVEQQDYRKYVYFFI